MLWNAKNAEVSIGNTKMPCASFGHGSRIFIILPGLSDGLATVRGKALLLAKPYVPFFDRFTVYMFSRKDAFAFLKARLGERIEQFSSVFRYRFG